MSNAGWGGPGDGAGPQGQGQGGPWQGGPQGGQGQGGPQGGAPQGPWQSPQWQQPPPQPPQGPGYGQAPGMQPPAPQRKRPWALLAVAASCILAMILVVGGGITFLALNRGGPEPVAGDPTTTTESVEPSDSEATSTAEETPTTEASDYSEFRVLGLGEFP